MGHIQDQVFDAIRILFCAGIVLLAYNTAKESGEKNGRNIAVIKSVASCFGIAIFLAAIQGAPSCSSSDGRGCDEYADDGYTPTDGQRLGTFAFWAILLTTPAALGAFEADKIVRNPRATPDRGV